MKATGYSLWLVPSRQESARLRGVIEEFANQYGGPVFDPHVTLVGGFEGEGGELQQKLQKLAFKKAPVLVCDAAAARKTYFQAFFLPVHLVPELKELHSEAQKIFDLPRPFFAHLSLAYGYFSEKDKNEMLLRTASLKGFSFTPVEIQLWKTEGEVSAWRYISSVLLTA